MKKAMLLASLFFASNAFAATVYNVSYAVNTDHFTNDSGDTFRSLPTMPKSGKIAIFSTDMKFNKEEKFVVSPINLSITFFPGSTATYVEPLSNTTATVPANATWGTSGGFVGLIDFSPASISIVEKQTRQFIVKTFGHNNFKMTNSLDMGSVRCMKSTLSPGKSCSSFINVMWDVEVEDTNTPVTTNPPVTNPPVTNPSTTKSFSVLYATSANHCTKSFNDTFNCSPVAALGGQMRIIGPNLVKYENVPTTDVNLTMTFGKNDVSYYDSSMPDKILTVPADVTRRGLGKKFMFASFNFSLNVFRSMPAFRPSSTP